MLETIQNIEPVKPKAKSTREVIQISHLNKSFGDRNVLLELNLVVHEGENVAVLGKSGSGKSVLIKCIIGLLKPEGGQINVLGKDIVDISREDLDRIRVRIGFLFQSNALYDSMTVRQNLEFPLRRHSIDLTKIEEEARVMEALRNVGLEHTINMMPVELSGGMRKRIALARTLILKPEIILYDEPTAGLDPITSREISHLMVEIAEKYNTSSLIISHDMNCIRATAERIVILVDGTCYAQGSYEELRKMNDPKIKQFFE